MTTNPSRETQKNVAAENKKLVEQLKGDWKLLWSERFNDKVKAEDVSIKEYTALYIEQGTIIHATRDFKALTFKEILDQHKVENPDRYIPPDAQAGGWKKFVKTNITNQPPKKRRATTDPTKKSTKKTAKNGRGWLHAT
jgi:hypothetical protein